MKPVAIAESENRKKKLEFTRPNSLGVRFSSFMIGTPAKPMIALSAKLIIMKKNSRATIAQPPFCATGPLVAGTGRPPTLSIAEGLSMAIHRTSPGIRRRNGQAPRSRARLRSR